MDDLTRRDFQRQGMGALITWSLLSTCFSVMRSGKSQVSDGQVA